MKIKIYLGIMALNISAIAQQNPTGNPPANNTNAQATAAWYRGGNTNINGTNNIFGTMWNSPVYHFTSGLQRMTLFDNTFNAATAGILNTSTPNGGGLAINLNPATPITRPWALLTIGEDNGFNSGWRNWMSVGTFNGKGSDNMYVGLKDEGGTGSDRQDAVINWGDNTPAGSGGGGNYGPDYLRFIFTSPYNTAGYPLISRGQNGLEVMRMNWAGKIGIGNYYNNPVESPFTKDPSNRLEILSDKTVATANGNPTFRLTHSQQDPGLITTTGLYSEFEPRNNGNLFISVRDNTQTNTATKILKERFTGFNTNTAGNTVEINSQLVSATTINGFAGFPSGSATGWAGLRFTDLKSNAITQANPGTGVLSVDANGDVIYVPGGANNANSGITVNGGNVQLGIDCSGSTMAQKIANGLVSNRTVNLAGKNLMFADGGRVGIGTALTTCAVGNKLEITSGTGMPYWPLLATNGSSGLRLTYLTSAKIPLANGVNGVDNTKVLSVDANGDVVLVNGGGSANADNGLSTNGPNAGAIHLGQSTGAIGNPGQLLDDREIPMNSHNILFKGNNPTGTSRISIGQDPLSTSLTAKLYTYNEVEANGVYSEMNGDNTPIFDFDFGVRTGLRTKNAIHGNIHSINTGPGACVGVLGESNSEYTAIGVVGYATSTSAITYGVQGLSRGTGNNGYGGVFSATGSVSNSNYGIYVDATNAAINNYAGYFNGNVYISGSFGPSDQNLKQNIDTISNALNIIKQLKPKSFDFKHSAYPSMNLPSGKQYGLIAQEVETILPDLVTTNTQPAKLDSAGNVITPAVNFKGLEYQQLIPFLIKAIQEQQTKIDNLTAKLNSKDSLQDARLTALENAVSQCCANASARSANSTINTLDIELSDKDAIVLNQNVPNPFAEQTTITYNVPASVGKAQIIFFNNLGQVIQTVDVKTRGKGKVNVFASDLSSGLYNYTLVADGKVIDSKKMVRE